MRGTLVVPTLNEAASVGHVLTTFRQAVDAANRTTFRNDPIDWQMLVVDGASTDGTAEAARAAGARVLVERRPGYGQAYLTAFHEVSTDLVATADGDATYPVEQVPAFVARLLEVPLDFISGDRLARLDRSSMTMEHRIGNRVLNQFLAVAYHRVLADLPGGTLRDSQSGFWVFRRPVLDRLRLTQTGMSFSEEIKLEAIFRGCRFQELPISYSERWGAPKLSSWRDGLRNLGFLFQKRFAMTREIQQAAARPSGTKLSRPDR
jgi:dolichol-phosphate hexosyltransferase